MMLILNDDNVIDLDEFNRNWLWNSFITSFFYMKIWKYERTRAFSTSSAIVSSDVEYCVDVEWA